MISENLPRGIRNNNPGNIRVAKIRWQGQKTAQFDQSFVEFDSPEMGLRALMKVLLTYYRKYDLDTVQSIINRWAPPHENATDGYAAHVAKRLKVKRTTVLNIEAAGTLCALAKAITVHENGRPSKGTPPCWYKDEVYQRACNQAML
jgi:hypothetical protein